MIGQKLSENHLKDILSKNNKRPFVLLETARFDERNHRSFIFDSLEDILIFDAGDALGSFFDKVDNYIKKGFWLAGFFSYEFGYLLEEKLFGCLPKDISLPLVWLGVFRPPAAIDHRNYPPSHHERGPSFIYRVNNVQPNITEKEYNSSIERIKKYIEEGDTYQVNFTFRLEFDFEGDARGLYLDLRKAQPTSHMAFLNTNKDSVLSFSPELFLSLYKNRVVAKPMKGTMPRGRFPKEDKIKRNLLGASYKNRAENLMIVDLLRNDLGKVAQKGTVEVRDLFSIEKYFTVFQMTSTIEAILKRKTSFKELIKATFPCGSVTGAPKIRTMQIIKELEKSPRGVYCGAVGYLSPHREACFNVAIRTIHINDKNKGILGIGAGVVYDSVDEKEYKESVLKAHFLTKKFPKIAIIETMRWSKEGFYLIDLHLRRLKKSCNYFNIPCHLKDIQKRLFSLEKLFNKDATYKVRLLVDDEGRAHLQYSLLEKLAFLPLVRLGERNTSSDNIYLYHKTTHRDFYDKEREKALRKGFWEVIFTNQKGELTEGSFTNIFLLQTGKLYTPSLECGLLGGVLREYLLENGAAEERIIYPQDILNATKVFVGNSVRGLVEVEVILSSSKALIKK